jgi:excisionase family DNA binding protein
MDSVKKQLLNVPEFADMCSIGVSTAHRLIARGDIPVCRIGRSVRINLDDAFAFIEQHRQHSERVDGTATSSSETPSKEAIA